MTSYPHNVNYDEGTSLEDAKLKAKKLIRQQAHITEEDNLTLVSENLSEEYSPMFMFKYEYRTDSPTPDEYNYDCLVNIIIATGKLGGIRVSPIITDIEVIQIDEAEQMAKEYIAQNSISGDASKFETTDVRIYISNGKIMYTFNFDYGSEYSYSLMMAATGEFESISREKKNN